MNYEPKDMTILVVDDTPENISILGDFLIDYNIKVATSGQKALKLAESSNLDLILLDIMMPEMDGYEVCRKLKHNPNTKDIPVIFLSALTEVKDKVTGFHLGAVDYITKPFQIEEVKSRIETHLSLSTYRKRLENINEELERMVNERTQQLFVEKNKAEEASKLKSHFLALMSHELRTPMVGILGFSEVIYEASNTDLIKDYAENLNKSATRLNETLSSILNFSALQAGKQTADLHPVNLGDYVAKIIQKHVKYAKIKGLTVNTSSIEKINTLTDYTMLGMIVNNVMNNAIKYTIEGSITVDIYSELRQNNLFDCISIKDTGIGIDKSQHQKIFEDFRQADEGFNRSFEGVGLGLSIVKQYVELLNGFIELESEPGKGSNFKLFFPHISNISFEEEELGTEKQLKIPEKKYKILIVEDNQLTIELEKLYLKEFGEIIDVDGGYAAIEQAKKIRFDAVIIDVSIGQGISGLDVIKEIKKINGYENTPIIAFTAYAMDGDKEFILNGGATHYLP
ncbi:MAG: response regulator, partial [Ignavibacteriaceae bacterium]|nr:response regulator [Ignavibacteriaceae bacterium]